MTIGVFDSGVGGLTVFHELSKRLPHEKLIYLGDTARVPYGTKSPETVTKYARQDSLFLVEKEVDLLVVACNTASALSLEVLQNEFSIPVIGVIEPGAKAAVQHTRAKKVGVIGTEATIKSEAYPKAIKRLNPEIEVLSRPCPLFVPLAEEGWTDNHIAAITADEYLKSLRDRVDVLVLGCTHYPLLREVIQNAVGTGVQLVCSSDETAKTVEKELPVRSTNSDAEGHEFYVSDNAPRFSLVGKRFLGKEKITDVAEVELDKH
ncbi:MAG: glutamate racemase [Nitrospinota bacterium]